MVVAVVVVVVILLLLVVAAAAVAAAAGAAAVLVGLIHIHPVVIPDADDCSSVLEPREPKTP